MATSKEIRGRIGSVQSTKKITRAMEMIAASKMRRARNRMEASKPYAMRALDIIHHLSRAHPEYHHAYLNDRPIKRVGFIVVSTDRGLCGGLNTNLFKTAIKAMKNFAENDIEVDVAVIGHRGEMFFQRIGSHVVAARNHIGDTPTTKDLIGAVKVMLDAYDDSKIDRLFLCANEFVSTIKQNPFCRQLLPVVPVEGERQRWDYIYEPGAKALLDTLLVRYIESQVYQGVVENIACEQAARMLAMKNATDNAMQVIDDLKLQYNKARQAAITKELAEIVSGAEAIDSSR